MSDNLPKIDRSFVGAIGLANWLKRHNYYVDPHQPSNVAEGCVWPGFKEAVEKYTGKDIHRYFLNYLNDISISFNNTTETCFDILIPSSFNVCHRRFAICKELCHILTDEYEVRICNPVNDLHSALQTVEQVQTASKTWGRSTLFTVTPLSSEDFCFLLALEILIPIKDRQQILIDAAKGVSNYDTAYGLRIPETLVRFYLESGYDFAFKFVGGIKLVAD